MLGDVVIQEKPEVEKKRDKLVVSMANDQKTLKEIEIRILKLLSESTEEQILDEDFLINVLEDSKKTSKEINERMEQSVIIQEEINDTRDMYRKVAIRGSILYFVIADLAKIDPMYQYSLSFVKRLFNTAIVQSEKNSDYEVRLEILIKNITEMLYTNVSRGLFEAHKIIYSFLITCNIRRNSGQIQDLWWNTLIRGAGPISIEDKRDQPENPAPKFISDIGWNIIWYINCADQPVFGGIAKDMIDNFEAWNRWLMCDEPQNEPIPSPWHEKLDRFQTMIVLKAFRPEKILFGMTKYVEDEQGRFYIESPSTSLEVIYKDMDVKTPLIFVLS
jgi:dynein heavy chain